MRQPVFRPDSTHAESPAATNTVTRHLTDLEYADLIRRLRELEATYQFKHNLIQESVHASLLKNDRRALHRACARALEQAFPNGLDEQAALLAQHYSEAGDNAETFEYAQRAGKYAMRINGNAEALMHYDLAISVSSRLQLAPQDLIDVHQTRGRVLELLGRFADAVTAYRTLQALGKTLDEPSIEIAALLSLATLFIFPNNLQDLRRGLEANQQALKLAQQTGDPAAEARALWNMQQHAFFNGRAREAVAYSKQALAIANRFGLDEMRAYILNDASRSLVSAVSTTSALESLAQAREIWQRTANLPMLVDNLSSTAETSHVAGKIEQAYDFVNQAQVLSRTISNTWNMAFSTGTLMTLYAQCGETRRALELAPDIIRLARESGFGIAEYMANIVRAGIYADLGNPSMARNTLPKNPAIESISFLAGWSYGAGAYLEVLVGNLNAARAAIQHLESVVNWDDLSTLGPIYVALCRSELALSEGDFATALDQARGLAERLDSLEIRDFLPEILQRQGRAHLGLGELDLAETVFARAETIARETQARFALLEIFSAQLELEQARGGHERLALIKLEATATIQWLAARAPDELRSTFLAQPRIRALLET